MTNEAEMVEKTGKTGLRWRKVTQVVGLLLLAVVCPFAALFVSPTKSRRSGEATVLEKEVDS
jgi:hypothetical protein